MNKKENEFFNKVKVIVTLLAIVVFILLTMFNAIFILLAPPLLVAISGIIYLTIFIINKCTSIFENKFKNDKDITKLLERINKKENELSNIKTICDEYSLNIIKYQFELEHLNNENLNINNSINKLLTDYATLIFDEQLKSTQEESKDRPLTKTKKPEYKNV